MKRILTLFLFLMLAAGSVTVAQPLANQQQFFENDDLYAFQESISKATIRKHADSLLLEAVKSGADRLALYLIEEGADVNTTNRKGQTPVHLAVSQRNESLLTLLLNQGANPNIQDSSSLQATALMLAVSQPDVKLTKLLLAHDAEVNQVDANLDPALNWATYYGLVPQMQVLIEAGANLYLESKHGDAVDVALRLWHADSVVQVFRETELNNQLSKKHRQLIEAVRTGDDANVYQLLNTGVDPNTTDGLGIPVLQLAAQTGDLKICQLLLENGALVNIQNRVGQTPLAFAARFKHSEVVNLLLTHEADVNLLDEHYQLSALIGAAVGGDVAIGEALLRKGANIDHQDSINDAAALHWAMFYGNQEFAEMLVRKGANLHSKILQDTYTGYSLAKAMNNEALVKLMDQFVRANHPILGSWWIKEIHYKYTDTTYVVKEAQPGTFLFTPERYAVIFTPTRAPRVAFENLSKPTKQEMVKAFQSIIFNTGQFTLHDQELVTTSDIARVPGFEGGKQFYRYAIDGDQLRITLFDETYPNGSKPDWYQKLEIMFILARE